MAGQWALIGNVVITVAYAGITVAIMVPLVHAKQVTTNRLALATALIFFSCAVGHSFHAVQYWQAAAGSHETMVHQPGWASATWDVITAGIGAYYWTLRRGYGVLLRGGVLYVDPQEQQRRHDIELRERVAAGRAAAEAERDAHAAMLSAVITNSQSSIYVKDLDGRYLLANEAFQRAFGVTEDELLGRTDDFLDAALAPTWRAHDLRARDGAFEVEEYRDAPDGRHTYESVKFPLHDAAGEVNAICGISLDVTRLRRAMAEVEHARDEAVTQSQVKSDFMATMSHEIRTPMNGVLGLASLLLGTALDPAQRRYAAGIHNAGNALLGVINDILDFSKIEAGRLDIDAEDFAVGTVLDEVAALVGPAAAEKNLSVVTRHDASLPVVVRGDGGRLRQILVNLAGNAVKFTEQGSVTLRAGMVAEPEPDTTVSIRFEVTDTGIGIDPDACDRLFEPFTQADASTTRTYGGTGLGLAICRRLAEAMGGTIGVDSKPGWGSTFWCVIPFEAPQGGVVTTAVDVSGLRADVSGLRVLVVDDDGDRTATLRANLRDWQISAAGAHSAAQALHNLREAAARGRPFDVLLIDTGPEVDASDLARVVDADTTVPTVIVLVLGADAPRSVWPADAGDLTYLVKPVHRSQLFDQLARSVSVGLHGMALGGTPRRLAAPAGATTPALVGVVSADAPIPVTMAPTNPAAPHAMPASTSNGAGHLPPAGDAAPEPAARVSRWRILLVEDNEINQLVAVGILTRLGYGCDVVADGSQALEKLAAQEYDIVLMDCRMPVMDGFTATTELRRREGDTRHTPVIAMTASALAADRERCLAAGMDDFVAKPVTLAELDGVLDRWLHTDTASAAAASVSPVSPVDAVDAVDAGPRPQEVTAQTGRDTADSNPAGGDTAGDEPGGQGVPGDPIVHRLRELAGERSVAELTALSQLITSFLQRWPQQLAALAAAVSAADERLVEDHAHSLAGAAGNIGAATLADLCHRLEDRGRDRDLTGVDDDLETLRAEIDQVDRRLRDILTGQTGPAS